MSTPDLYPSGLAPQRTVLAWRRTLIGLLVGSVVAQRVLAQTLGAWSFVVSVTGLLASALIWVAAERRARRWSLAWNASGPTPGGVLLLVLAMLATAAAVIAITYLMGDFALH